MAFVPSSLDDQSDTAKLLLAMADEAGMDPHVVQVVRGGFRVPDELLVVDGTPILVQPEVPEIAAPLNPPPAWWNEPAPTVDVIFDHETGQVLLKDEAKIVEPEVAKAEPGLEEMRDWARANGHVVADKGKLKNVVVEAFKAAHQTSL